MADVEQSSDTSSTPSVIITVFFLIFFPPIGIIVMWFWPKWRIWVKIAITLIMALSFAIPIAILSTTALSGLNSAQKSARDSQRIQNINTARTALERYYADNRRYPFGKGTCNGTYGFSDLFSGRADSLSSSGYLSSFVDPLTKKSVLEGTETYPEEVNGVSVCGLEVTTGVTYLYSGGKDGKSYEIIFRGETGREQIFTSPE